MTTKGRDLDDKDLEDISGGSKIDDKKTTKPTVVTVRGERTESVSDD